ncbi:dihydropteroate synthase [Curvibacter sp. RS43]|uniref:Dihydropteroate synthase n=1 Tax=Curvibacter microcysteis TaxID=3026419 RepID=A0ABT5MC50_9BURK|nr:MULTISPECIES: dihydropteroate synthase [unclassified Curvibacter]MDD0809076.1 dihydropteroate synthase [Curvibacter sp. RS43]MDD0814145.1 dihydropteroate synthase [Curvibacter sp. HBC28]
MFWQTSRFRLELNRPLVMGIVNATPDSFSDGGQHASLQQAVDHARLLLEQGADLLDIGGESTRPGSPAVGLDEEWARIGPLLRELVRWEVPLSVDTYKPEVMQRALDLGVDIVNDIWALRQPGARDVVAAHPSCGVCLMHMHRDPQTMQVLPMEGDVLPQVLAFLHDASAGLMACGVARDRIVLDAGVGFGKTVEQNFALLSRQHELDQSGWPWLAGWSRKSSLGAVTGLPVEDRLVPSTTAAVLAADRGARVLRVHDVRETVAALQVWQAVRQAQASPSPVHSSSVHASHSD